MRLVSPVNIASILLLVTIVIGCGSGTPNATDCAEDPEACLAYYHDQVVEECVPEALVKIYSDGFQWKDDTTRQRPFDVGAATARIPASAGSGYSTRARVEYLGEVGTGTDPFTRERVTVYLYCGYDLRDSDFMLGGAVLKNYEQYRDMRYLNLINWQPISR